MATWAQIKETMAASDELRAALGRLGDLHGSLIDRNDVEGLRSLARVLLTLAAANEPEVKRPSAQCPGQGCSDQGCPSHYAG